MVAIDDDEVTLVPGGSGLLEVGDATVGDGDGVVDMVGQRTESAAKDDGYPGYLPVAECADISCAFVYLLYVHIAVGVMGSGKNGFEGG
jgi:hypothetical protein